MKHSYLALIFAAVCGFFALSVSATDVMDKTDVQTADQLNMDDGAADNLWARPYLAYPAADYCALYPYSAYCSYGYSYGYAYPLGWWGGWWGGRGYGHSHHGHSGHSGHGHHRR